MSDTHDNFDIVDKVAEVFKQEEASGFIHCGDITSAKMVQLFKDKGLTNGFFVQGNMDEKNLDEIKKAIEECGYSFVGLNSNTGLGDDVNNDYVLAYVTHGDNKNSLKEALDSEDFDFIFYGHTHKKSIEKSGKTIVVNVGALSKDTPKDSRGFFVLDTATKELKFIQV